MTDQARKTIYIDMDGVLVNFKSGIEAIKHRYPEKDPESHDANWDNVPGIFGLMKPQPGAVEAYKRLSAEHDVFILSTAPWANATAWHDKLEWVKEHLPASKGEAAHKRLILSHRKDLNRGDFLIDDRTANGAADFEGTHVHFGPSCGEQNCRVHAFDWDAVLHYFEKEGLLEKQGE
jgi:5'-nucleotidase